MYFYYQQTSLTNTSFKALAERH